MTVSKSLFAWVAVLACSIGVFWTLPAFAEEDSSAQSLKSTLDDRIKSVQNKFFLKKNRFEITPFGALTLNDPFKQRIMVGGHAVYHITDMFGAGLTGGYNFNKESDTTVFVQAAGAPPETSNLKYLLTLDFLWTPIYGKISFFASWIVNFDWYLVAGGGAFGAEVPEGDQADLEGAGYKPTACLGTGQRWFINRWLAFNWELRDYIYSLQIGEDKLAAEVGDIQNQIYVFVGLSFFIPFSFEYED
jgi:outer membrane beta-barrel protein